MSEHGKHHHCHGHGGEGHWGEPSEHPRHRHSTECCGGHAEHPRHSGECGCGREGQAGGPGSAFRRHFFTREEQVAGLEEYLKELQAEAKGVEERIAALKANG